MDSTSGFDYRIKPFYRSGVRLRWVQLDQTHLEGENEMATANKGKSSQMTLGAVVAHPLRSQCLTILAERTASPAELAVELDENLGNVSYHVRKLWKGGAVEIVEEKPVRGAMEHFYRATRVPHFSDGESAEATADEREVITRQIFSLMTANATSALEAGTMVGRSDFHITRLPTRVDEQGWEEMRDVFLEMLDRQFEVQRKSAERLGGTDDAGIPIIAFNTFFEMPERPKADD
jgi:DNA-binding transcriptional ArsR family regulator